MTSQPETTNEPESTTMYGVFFDPSPSGDRRNWHRIAKVTKFPSGQYEAPSVWRERSDGPEPIAVGRSELEALAMAISVFYRRSMRLSAESEEIKRKLAVVEQELKNASEMVEDCCQLFVDFRTMEKTTPKEPMV